MCGIAGIYRPGHSVQRSLLDLAADRLAHRGPDGSGHYYDGDVGLVHTRLSIIDLEGGRQPLISPDGRYQLVANGEVYNDPELREYLRESRPAALTGSDCESIHQVWSAEGVEGLQRLHGMFAFALFDTQERELIIGRDRTGIKPLYIAIESGGVCFASELKALLPLMSHSPEIASASLAEFFDFQFSSGGKTILTGVEQLNPGEILRIDRRGAIKRQTWWSLAETRSQTVTMDEALEEFDSLFEQVMREHMRSDVPFGLFLSGGIDSSILLAELAALQGESLRTFSIGYRGTDMQDELDVATELAAHFGARHEAVRVGKDELFASIVRSVWAADDLMRDYANLPTLLLSELAGKEIKVVFSGEGGDEAFAGYRRYKPGLAPLLKGSLLGAGGHRSRAQWTGKKRLLMREPLRSHASRKQFVDSWNEAPPDWTWMQKSQYVDTRTALADNLLVKADRMMMSGGLEGRVPFSDHRLVQWGLSLPDKVKYGKPGGKLLLRKWAARRLPMNVLDRPKRGFYVPVAEWLQGEFLDQLEPLLKNSEPVREWFHPDAVDRLFGWQRRGTNCSREIFSLMQFAIWYRLIIESPDSRPDFRENPLDWIA